MQGIARAVRSCQEVLKAAALEHSHWRAIARIEKLGSSCKWVSFPALKGLENVTVEDVLTNKSEGPGPWLWCHTDDSVIDAVKNVCPKSDVHILYSAVRNLNPFLIYISMRMKLQMAKNNIGSLVVLKPGEQQYIAGIITERGNIVTELTSFI